MVFFSRQFRAQISSTDIPCKTFRFLSNYVVNQEHDCTLIALSYLSSLSSQNSRKKNPEQKVHISHSCSLCTSN